MSWAKIDDQFFTHPKVIDLPKDAKLLYLASVTYCAGQLTDGHITPGALRVIAAMVDVSRDEAGALVTAGLWEITDNGFAIHDYLEYQPTRDKAMATRQARAEAGSRGGHKSADGKAEAKAQANGKQNAEQNGKPISTPSPSESESRSESSLRSDSPPNPPLGGGAGAVGNCVSLFIDGFRGKHEGEDPHIMPPQAKKLRAYMDDVGRDRFAACLAGFFADAWAGEQGHSVTTFLSQSADRWSRRKEPSRAKQNPRPSGGHPPAPGGITPEQINNGWTADQLPQRVSDP